MNERFRLPIAVLISLLLHMAVLMWAMQFVNARVPDGQRLLQVFLQNYSPVQERPLQATAGIAAPNKPGPKPENKQTEIPSLPRSPGSGHLLAQHPLYPPSDQMNAMHLAQLSQQRDMRRSAVMAGLSNLATQLRPVIDSKIVCVQQANYEIDCTPEPDKKVRPLLEHFFSLGMEARQLGIADNPVHIDFSAEQSVSVTLLH